MKQQDKKKAAVLVALLVILAAYWTYHLFIEKTPGAKAPAPAAQGRGAAAKARPMAAIKVDLGLLGGQRPAYRSGRNIFSPVYVKPALVKPTQQPKGQQQPITVTPLPPLPPPPPPKSAEEIAAENAREEIKKFKVLGFIKRKGKTDVFMSLGGDHFTVTAGGNITKDYFLAEVGQDFVVITDHATGVTEKVKTQLASKPTSMPGGSVAGGGAGGAQTGGGWVPPAYQGGGMPPGRPGMGGAPGPVPGGGVIGGGGTTLMPVPQVAPTPLGGHSIR